MLFILNSENRWHRVLRRAIVVGVLAGVAVVVKDFIIDAPLILVPILAAIGAAIDKYTRERSE